MKTVKEVVLKSFNPRMFLLSFVSLISVLVAAIIFAAIFSFAILPLINFNSIGSMQLGLILLGSAALFFFILSLFQSFSDAFALSGATELFVLDKIDFHKSIENAALRYFTLFKVNLVFYLFTWIFLLALILLLNPLNSAQMTSLDLNFFLNGSDKLIFQAVLFFSALMIFKWILFLFTPMFAVISSVTALDSLGALKSLKKAFNIAKFNYAENFGLAVSALLVSIFIFSLGSLILAAISLSLLIYVKSDLINLILMIVWGIYSLFVLLSSMNVCYSVQSKLFLIGNQRLSVLEEEERFKETFERKMPSRLTEIEEMHEVPPISVEEKPEVEVIKKEERGIFARIFRKKEEKERRSLPSELELREEDEFLKEKAPEIVSIEKPRMRTFDKVESIEKSIEEKISQESLKKFISEVSKHEEQAKKFSGRPSPVKKEIKKTKVSKAGKKK